MKTVTFSIALALFGLQAGLMASGSAGGGFSRVGGIDQNKYNEGKAIFNRKVSLAEQVSEDVLQSQSQKLISLEEKIPDEARKKGRLTELAGKLTNDQLNALEHFVTVRYNIK